MKSYKYILFFVIMSGIVYADNINTLLDNYAQNSDLSEKTKLENSGTVMIFSRKDLDIMQARNLRDVLKSIPSVGYNENRFSFVDSLYHGGTSPSSSSRIRVFMNDHEVTSGVTSSGLLIMGNIDLGFIDHIEIYTQSPSFEYSSEPAYLLIKLYSKEAQRDAGGIVELSYGNRGFNQESLFYAEELEDFSYMVYLSRLDDKREDLGSRESPLSRDLERYNLFALLSTQNHKVQFNVQSTKHDSFIGMSLDATPSISKADYNYIFLGYSYKYRDALTLNISAEKMKNFVHFQDNPEYKETPLSALYDEFEDNTDAYNLISDLKYTFKTEKNKLVFGLKGEYKYFDYQMRKEDGINLTPAEFDEQIITALYAEEQYFFNDFNIINFGLKYSYIHNNGLMDNSDLWSARFGHTYTTEAWVFKTFAHYSQSPLDTIHAVMNINLQKVDNLKVEKTTTLTEEIKYTHKAHEVKTLLSYSMIEDTIIADRNKIFYNHDQDISVFNSQLQYTYQLNLNHKLMMGLSYSSMTHIPYVDEVDYYDGFIRTLHRFDEWDLFTELVYNHNNNGENGYDVSLGAKYMVNDHFKLSIKGENIFGTAEESSYFRLYMPAPTYQPVFGEPLKAAPIEQRIYMTFEYQF